jgi:hypothetical protein
MLGIMLIIAIHDFRIRQAKSYLPDKGALNEGDLVLPDDPGSAIAKRERK